MAGFSGGLGDSGTSQINSISRTDGFRSAAVPKFPSITDYYRQPIKPVTSVIPEAEKTNLSSVDYTVDPLSNDSNNNGSRQAAIDLGTQVSLEAGGKQLPTDPRQMVSGLLGVGSMFVPALGVGAALTDVAPRAEYAGSPGSIGPNGGMYNDMGREVDQITGQNYGYSHRGAFLNGNYVQGIKDAKGFNDTTQAIFSDPDNAFKYDRSLGAPAQGFQFAVANSPSLKAGSMTDRNTMGLKVGLDQGIPEHSLVDIRTNDGKWIDDEFVYDGSKTILGTSSKLDNIMGLTSPSRNSDGVEYGSSVAHGMDANPGDKQGGVHSTTGDQDSGSTVGTTSATATVGNQGAYSSYADDAQASGSGTGGGKG